MRVKDRSIKDQDYVKVVNVAIQKSPKQGKTSGSTRISGKSISY